MSGGVSGSPNSVGDAPGGAGGQAVDSLNVGTLTGGSGGASGAAGTGANAPGGGGGGGGGAIQIVAPTIQVTGVIDSRGGKGGDQTGAGDGGAGGGGAGGSIWLRGRTVDLQGGNVVATGGAGGVASVESPPNGGNGGAGSAGRIQIDALKTVGTTSPTFSEGIPPNINATAFPLAMSQPDDNTVTLKNTSGAEAELRLILVH